jgi:ubiquinone/menaquinone biosynthesis C-methylase UbiE
MPDHKKIYKTQAGKYDLLVSREDYQKNLFPALNQVRPLDGLDVVEFGAGTGRLTCMMAPVVKSILAFDASQHMLGVATTKLEKAGLQNWKVAVADNRSLPVGDQIADIAISGWSICYLFAWEGERWRDELGKALAEMKRVLRPSGSIIILETLGKGYETPHPLDKLTAYYTYLEEAGFFSTWIRTDFQFKSLAEAEELTRFFFGDQLADRVAREGLVILPECTGIWWLTR